MICWSNQGYAYNLVFSDVVDGERVVFDVQVLYNVVAKILQCEVSKLRAAILVRSKKTRILDIKHWEMVENFLLLYEDGDEELVGII